MGLFFTSFTRYLLVGYLLFTATKYSLNNKSYSISPKEFKSIAARIANVKPDVRNAVAGITSGLANSYKTLITHRYEWYPLALGVLELNILPLHLSLTEFAVIIGAPYETTGRAGLHWANTTCTVLSGSVSRVQDSAGLEDSTTFSVGGNFRHGEFESYNYKFAEGSYMACYGRGLVPLSGLWTTGSTIAHGEIFGPVRLSFAFIQSVYNQYAVSLQQTFNHYKSRATGKNEL